MLRVLPVISGIVGLSFGLGSLKVCFRSFDCICISIILHDGSECLGWQWNGYTFVMGCIGDLGTFLFILHI